MERLGTDTGLPPMRLHDTARQAVVPFDPPEHVLMYTCGITPYDATHVTVWPRSISRRCSTS